MRPCEELSNNSGLSPLGQKWINELLKASRRFFFTRSNTSPRPSVSSSPMMWWREIVLQQRHVCGYEPDPCAVITCRQVRRWFSPAASYRGNGGHLGCSILFNTVSQIISKMSKHEACVVSGPARIRLVLFESKKWLNEGLVVSCCNKKLLCCVFIPPKCCLRKHLSKRGRLMVNLSMAFCVAAHNLND